MGSIHLSPGPASESGFTFFEILIATFVLAVGACALSAVLVHGMTLGTVNTESHRAQEAARQILEQVSTVSVSRIFATYNADPNDDPNGVGTARGNTLPVTACSELNATAVVEFPGGTNQLREDAVDPELGLPMDLNGDGAIDAADHAGDYVLLPIRVRVTWTGATGPRSVTVCAVLSTD